MAVLIFGPNTSPGKIVTISNFSASGNSEWNFQAAFSASVLDFSYGFYLSSSSGSDQSSTVKTFFDLSVTSITVATEEVITSLFTLFFWQALHMDKVPSIAGFSNLE